MRATAETAKERWQRETLEPALKKAPERAPTFTTISGHPVERLYTSDDTAAIDHRQDIGRILQIQGRCRLARLRSRCAEQHP